MSGDAEAGQERLEIDNKYLCGSRLTRVNLKDSFVGDSVLIGAELNDVNASALKIGNANLSDARFENVNLSGATIENATLSGFSIRNARVDGMTINGVAVADLFAAWEARDTD